MGVEPDMILCTTQIDLQSMADQVTYVVALPHGKHI